MIKKNYLVIFLLNSVNNDTEIVKRIHHANILVEWSSIICLKQ